MQLAERYTPGGVSNLMLVGGTQQVMLQVRFAEMQRTVRQELSTSLGVQTVTPGFGTNALGARHRHRRPRLLVRLAPSTDEPVPCRSPSARAPHRSASSSKPLNPTA
jgi:hypothetical protein